MIDIHSHLLFGVDDGPATMEGTMRLIEGAVAEGISQLIVTPHAYSPQYDVQVGEIESQVRLIQEIIQAADIELTLFTGQEVRIHEDLARNLLNQDILTLAESRYLLLELPTENVPVYTANIVHSLLERDIIPIIAHPERNKGIAENPQRLERLVRQGALAQVTAGSAAGYFGKPIQKLSMQLIEANLIHAYGSDAHHIDTRPFLFNKGLDIIGKKLGVDTVDMLLVNNRNILTDQIWTVFEPEDTVSRKWWSLNRRKLIGI